MKRSARSCIFFYLFSVLFTTEIPSQRTIAKIWHNEWIIPENFRPSGKKTHDKNVMFNLNGINLSCEDEVKLLGVTIDFKLNFNTHISNICKGTTI
jgi:hypothetical protein